MPHSCNIADLAEEGRALGFDAFDKTELLAAKLFLMADTIRDLTGGEVNYTDICALASSMSQYHGLSHYQNQSAQLVAWGEIHKITAQEDPDWDAVKAAVTCAKCDNIGSEDLENSFTFLLCTLAHLVEGP